MMSPIKLVFLSLINPNKNLHLIIEAVSRLENFFILDIYGPVINETYWALCEEKILNKEQVRYRGPVPAWDVPNVLGQYNYFVLPTQGENFGHAIFDSLSCGVPVVISRHTPWKDLDTHKAGFYVEETVESIYQQLQAIQDITPSTYHQYRENSLKYATDYLSANDYSADYKFLFDN
jgi:glycosyltransferase involved in cell wall biosynthesis